jgi:hypothetical protein
MKIVVRLLAESLVVVVLMAFGWWGMTTLGRDSLQPMSEPIYVAGCPQADTLQKGSGAWAVQRRAYLTRSPHAGPELD